jgi:hypothetical protein
LKEDFNSKFFVSDKEKKQRLNICLSCPDLIKLTKTCSKCGCFMELKTKVKMSVCPVGKW